ncbi:MAG: transcriptional activator RfaH [Desulfopila sp.]
MTDTQPAWYAIRTKPNNEKVARLNYEQQGFTVYLPLISKVVRHARQKKQVLRPFFPGYLFLHLAPEERNWPTIAATRGSAGPVHFGESYIPVPDWLVDTLKEREEKGAISQAALKRQTIRAGDTVTVNLNDGGATEGLFFSWRGEENVIVLLNFLGRMVRTTLPQDRVEPQATSGT